MTLPLRSRVAVAATRGVNAVSRRLGAGSGTVIGGRAGLAIDPDLLARLAAGRRLALVSGTNGKTTTTRLLAVALEAGAQDLGARGAGTPAAQAVAEDLETRDAGTPEARAAAGGQPGTGMDRRGSRGTARGVVTNTTGANMPAGHVAALAAGRPGAPAVLEVDEGYLPGLVRTLRPAAVLLLNLSRDQLDRTNEVRMLAGRWREALAGAGETTVVANADDPLVVWGAGAAPRVVWVGAGLGWQLDAVGCPACEGRIVFATAGAGADGPDGDPGRFRGNVPEAGDRPGGGWSCTCGFARPAVDVEVIDRLGPAGPSVGAAPGGGGSEAVWSDGRRLGVALRIPGRFNRANAVMAAAAAEALGVPADRALAAMATVGEVGGRFTVRRIGGVDTRLLLAKNPAGWHELLELVCPGRSPVVVGINARVADGRDPSWLWDVPFERLRGRPVVATGERCLDLAVRLRYAEVPHRTVRDPEAAVALAGRDVSAETRPAVGDALDVASSAADGARGAEVEFIGNYTAFFDLLEGR